MCHQDKECMWIKILKLRFSYTRQKKKSQIWGMFSLDFGLKGIYKLQPKKGKTKENHKVKDINQQSRQISRKLFGVRVALALARSHPYRTLYSFDKSLFYHLLIPSHLNMSSRGYKKMTHSPSL